MPKSLAEFTPDQLRLLARKLNGKKGASPGESLRRRDPSATRFPLSYAQERLWLIQQLMPGMPSYNAPFVMRLRLPMNPEVWQQVMTEMARRHEVFRTTIQVIDGVPTQVVAPPSPVRVAVHDLRHLPREEREPTALALIRDDIGRGFDLSEGPLWRFGLIAVEDGETLHYSTVHHSICDGLSRHILLHEVPTLATPLLSGRAMATMPPLPVQYGDYALWQREQIQGAAFEASLKYWKAKLENLTEIDLHTDFPRPPVARFRAGSYGLTIPRPVIEKLRQLSKTSHATLFMTMLAAFQVLLQRYTGQDDVAVGTPVSTRNRVELERLIGYFVNTLLLRNDLSGAPTFRELLARVRQTCVDGYSNQDLPFERLVQELNVKRDLSRNPLFQIAFQLEEVAAAPAGPSGADGLADYLNFDHFAMTVANLDLDVHLFGDWEDGLVKRSQDFRGVITYDADLFAPETIERMAGHYRVLLEAIAASPDTRISEMPLLTEPERRQLAAWNSTAREYPPDLLVEMFEASAERAGDAEALVFDGRRITYRELNLRANQLAHRLRAVGVGPEVLVGVCAERSIEMVVALLGILKAGGAYLPIAPSEPEARLRFMIEDSGIHVVVAQDALRPQLEWLTPRSIYLSPSFDEISGEPDLNPDIAIDPRNLAYAIWTSGSTGKPKAAMNTHQSLANMLQYMQENHPMRPGDRILQKTAFHFDVSILEFFCPLIAGATLVIARPGGHREPQYLARLIAAESIGTVHFVPTMLEAFLQCGELERCPSLTTVICIGEPLTAALCRDFYRQSGAQLYNMYGPAEAAVAVTRHHCLPADVLTVPIGRPIANTRIYILDRGLQPAAVGVPGEIYIAGANVGRGYLGRPDITAERFVPDPFSVLPGARMYRTGDLARMLPDGNIEFLGRLDYQIKIRGNRVELGEIEAVLAEHPAVHGAVVTVYEDPSRGKSLAAYLAASADCGAAQLREFLKTRVPEYMIPQDFVFLDALPQTGSGKVDRRALPQPAPHSNCLPPVSPRDSIELKILHIWQDLLGISSIGIQDDFFLIGGHSILAVRLLARIAQTFGRELPLAEFYQNPTIEQMGLALRRNASAQAADPLIAIRPSASGHPPIFLIHAAGGRSITYYELARSLPADIPVYGLEDVSGTDTSVNAMAARYVEAVRRVQPRGPYFLGGWSTGATVAFEMARQLRTAGQEIGLLALLDAFSPHRPKLSDADPGAASARVLATIARNLTIYAGQSVAISESDFLGRTPEDQMSFFLEEAKTRNLFPADLSIAFVRGFLEVSERHVRAFWDYEGRRAGERLLLFRSSEPLTWGIEEENELAALDDFGWQRFSSEPVRIQSVPGNHVTMFQQPQVRELARLLSEEIRAARVEEFAEEFATACGGAK
jgi:amino acid adenylation domain-containing protein